MKNVSLLILVLFVFVACSPVVGFAQADQADVLAIEVDEVVDVEEVVDEEGDLIDETDWEALWGEDLSDDDLFADLEEAGETE
jgi:hypothetical protein